MRARRVPRVRGWVERRSTTNRRYESSWLMYFN